MILGIYGSGGSGREVHEIAKQQKMWNEIIFIDDIAEAGEFRNTKRMSFDSFCKIYSKEETKIAIALGEPEYKIDLYYKVKEKGYQLANIIHPVAWVSPSATLMEGVIVHAQSFISSDVLIEANVCIEPGVIVGHDCIIHKNCQIAPAAVLGGNCEIGEGSYIGMCVPVKECTKIGSSSVIGMGSVVMRDIPDNVIALGNPARAMKHKDNTKVFR